MSILAPDYTLVFSDVGEGNPELADLMGVIAGPVSPNNGNTTEHDFTPQLLDIGVTSIRNQSNQDASLDIDRMLDCSRASAKRHTAVGKDGSTFGICTNSRLGSQGTEEEFPCWDGCDRSKGDFGQYMEYANSKSNDRMDAIVANFEPFFRLGGENNTKQLFGGRVANDDVCAEMIADNYHIPTCQTGDWDGHSFSGPQTAEEELNWQYAARAAVIHFIARYETMYPGQTKIQWLDIWTEFAGADSFFDQFAYSGGTTLLTSATSGKPTSPTLEAQRAANIAAFAPFFAESARFLRAAFPSQKIKIGGPGFLDFSALMNGDLPEGSIRAVLTAVYKEGTGIPLDFVDMHLLAEATDPRLFYEAPRAMRDLLDGVKGGCTSDVCKRICKGKGCSWDYRSVPWQESTADNPPASPFFANTRIVIGAYEVNANAGGEENTALKTLGKGAAMQTGFYIAMQHSRLVTKAYVYRSSDMQDYVSGTSEGDLGMFYSLRKGKNGVLLTPRAGSFPYHKPKAHAMRLWSILARDYPLLLTSDLTAKRTGSDQVLWVLGGARRAPSSSAGSTSTGGGTSRDRAVLIANTNDTAKTFTLTYNTATTENKPGILTSLMADFRSTVQQFQVGDVEEGRVNMASFNANGHLTIGANSVSLVTFTLPTQAPEAGGRAVPAKGGKGDRSPKGPPKSSPAGGRSGSKR